MKHYILESNVPIPHKHGRPSLGLQHIYDLIERAQVGESFLVKNGREWRYCLIIAKRRGKRATSRKEGDSFRVWVTE